MTIDEFGDYFEEIRPFNDGEVEEAIKEQMLTHPYTFKITEKLFPETTPEKMKKVLSGIHTVEQFQAVVSIPLFRKVMATTSDGLEFRGFEHLKKDTTYLFISTHRDILLDSVLLNVFFSKKGYDLTESAVGTNLLENSFLRVIALLNRNFLVLRNASSKEIFEYSRKVSSYIQHVLNIKKRSIWLSQREGRTKDGDDRTHPGILKMVHMAKPKDQSSLEFLASLKIIPMSVSYERDPTLAMRLPSILAEKNDQPYTKTKNEDALNMIEGLLSYKKKICITLSPPVTAEDLALLQQERLPLNGFIKNIGTYIDGVIHRNYKLYPSNYIAFDILNGDVRHQKIQYSTVDKAAFIADIKKMAEASEIPSEQAENIAIAIYAKPVSNHYEAIS